MEGHHYTERIEKDLKEISSHVELVSGEDVLEDFKAYMNEKELGECIHCEGFDG